MFILLMAIVLLAITAMVYVQYWTFRTIQQRKLSRHWKFSAIAAVGFGSIVGLVSGHVVRWQPSANLEYVGFPIPATELLYEDGGWVAYEGPPIFISPILNGLLLGTIFILPLTVLLVARLPPKP